MKRSRGTRTSSRGLRKKPRERGLSKITRTLVTFNDGEKVAIVIDPSIHKGMPHPKYQGITGTIVARRGEAYVLNVRLGAKEKHVIARPEHLRRV